MKNKTTPLLGAFVLGFAFGGSISSVILKTYNLYIIILVAFIFAFSFSLSLYWLVKRYDTKKNEKRIIIVKLERLENTFKEIHDYFLKTASHTKTQFGYMVNVCDCVSSDIENVETVFNKFETIKDRLSFSEMSKLNRQFKRKLTNASVAGGEYFDYSESEQIEISTNYRNIHDLIIELMTKVNKI